MNTMSLLLCVVVTLFYSTTIVNGNCPDDDPFSSPFYKGVKVSAAIECPIARDCKAWLEAGVNKSGIYPIKPDNKGSAFQVYCDMETDGGGWTVFQRRQDGSVDFNRNWIDYEKGFGNLTGEFWLGLSKMHRLTPDGENTLRVDLGDCENNTTYTRYNEFEILDATAEYALVVQGYSGTVGDSLTGHNIMRFSTKDKDHDTIQDGNCAQYHQGGWWFSSCFISHLNGPYVPGCNTNDWIGIIWYHWKGKKYSLKFTEMKVRRK